MGPSRTMVAAPFRIGVLSGFVTLPLLLVPLSCGGSDGSGPSGPSDPETPRATTVILSPDSVHLDRIGATTQISATVRDQNGQVMTGATLSWGSTAPTVASVSSSGLVTALAEGGTTIQALSGTASSSARVIVARVLFQAHAMETTTNGIAGLHVEDMDGDGDLDVLATSLSGDAVTLWQNEGGSPLAWTRLSVGGDFEAALYAHGADVDGDGRMDVIATGGGPDAGVVAWWRNDGGDPSGWAQQTLAQDFMGASGVVSGDFDGDGNTDVLAAAINDSEIAWWQNSGTDPVAWTKHTITDGFQGVQSVMAADLDGDGRLDVLGGSGPDGENRDQVAWWRNEGGNPPAWTKQIIAPGFTFAHWVYADDVDDDGRIDVLGMSYSGNEVAWWRNGGGTSPTWTKQTIDGGFTHALTVCTADMDGDGDLDVLGTAWTPDHEVAWWEAVGTFPDIEWRKHVIADSFTGAWPLIAADLDGDGDQDVVAGADVLNSGGQSAPLTWWESLRIGGS